MNDEEFGRHLPELLGDAKLPPSTVDVGVAITVGRRRRRRPYVAGAAALLVLVAVAPIALLSQRPQAPPQVPPGSPPPATATPEARQCVLAERPSGFKDFLTDPSGRYFGGSYVTGRAADREFMERPAMWVEGKVHQLPLPADQWGYLAAINERGVAVGGAGTGTDHSTFAYVDGTIVPLAGGRRANVTAISASGVIVGTQIGSDDSERPVRWLSPTSPPERLVLPSGAIGGRTAYVSPRGDVTGTVFFPGEAGQIWVPYRWDQSGAGRPLVIAEGFKAGVGAGNGDWVHGGYHLENGLATIDSGALLLNLHTGENRRFRDFVIEGEKSVTADGWFIGYARGAARVRVLTNGDDSISLPDPPGKPLTFLNGVSADGKVIVGSMRKGEDDWFGLIWRCG